MNTEQLDLKQGGPEKKIGLLFPKFTKANLFLRKGPPHAKKKTKTDRTSATTAAPPPL